MKIKESGDIENVGFNKEKLIKEVETFIDNKKIESLENEWSLVG